MKMIIILLVILRGREFDFRNIRNNSGRKLHEHLPPRWFQ